MNIILDASALSVLMLEMVACVETAGRSEE